MIKQPVNINIHFLKMKDLTVYIFLKIRYILWGNKDTSILIPSEDCAL